MNFPLRIHLLAIAFIFYSQPAGAVLPEDPGEYVTWENEMLDAIKNYSQQSDEIAIEKLGSYLFNLEYSSNREKEPRPVFTAARDALLAKPNYGIHFRNRLADANKKWKEGEWHGRYDETRDRIIRTLGLLPSRQSVEVLGGLLGDEEWTGDRINENVTVPNAYLAQIELGRMLEDPPAPIGMLHELQANVQIWELWFENIKEQGRTFRFKGNPQPYNLHGPVNALAPSSPRKIEREMPKDAEGLEKQQDTPWLSLSLAVLALCFAAWWARRNPKA